MFASFRDMNYPIEYFHKRVKAEIESWPDGILADFARIVELCKRPINPIFTA
jgi:hypothetical protein